MTRTPATLILAASLLCAASCQSNSKSNSPPGATAAQLEKMSDAQIAEKTFAFMQQLIDVGEPAKSNCDKMADAMQKVLDANGPLLAVMKKYRSDPDKQKWFDDNYGERSKKIGMWFMQVPLRNCGKNPKMRKVATTLLPPK